MSISTTDYFGKWVHCPDATTERYINAQKLLAVVNVLIGVAEQDSVEFKVNPTTGTLVSGTQYGGFRPQSCCEGAPHSSHKEGLAVDLYDPEGKIDEWCMANFDKLEACGIYIEHPDSTPHWSHWTIRAPKSGHRAFYP